MFRAPRARKALLTNDHSKSGRRFVSVVDPETLRVALLEPDEHLILLLCDGHREAKAIAKLAGATERAVRRTLIRLEHEHLIEEGVPLECFEIPTGEYDAIEAPFDEGSLAPTPGLEPTIAWVADEDSA